jgi:ribose/xylose/arabinose/galactoside ABC-type transport system permease subunit
VLTGRQDIRQRSGRNSGIILKIGLKTFSLQTIFVPLLGPFAVVVIGILFATNFFSVGNFSNLSRQVGFLSVVALGQMTVLLVRGIDLSVGALMTLAMVFVARNSRETDTDAKLLILGALIVGVIVGLANAYLVLGRNIPPFVATLAMYLLLTGVISIWTKGVPSGEVPVILKQLGATKVAGLPIPTAVGVVMTALLMILLSRTVFGTWIYATGQNPEAAKIAGVPVGLVTALAYVICSICAVIGGLLLSGYIGYVDRYLGQGWELDSIAAAIVGGTAFVGGRGGAFRTLGGVFTIAGISNVILLTGADRWLRFVSTGMIIIVSMVLQSEKIGLVKDVP